MFNNFTANLRSLAPSYGKADTGSNRSGTVYVLEMLMGITFLRSVLLVLSIAGHQVAFCQNPPDTFDITKILDINPYEPLSKNGRVFDGLVIRRIKSGRIIDMETSVGGKKNGPAWYFYNDGKPKGQGNFVDNSRDGHWTWWYETGEVRQDGYFVKGIAEGYMKTFDIRNGVHVDGPYVNGRFHGMVIGYKSDGDTIAYGEYSNGYKVGPWIEFDLDSNHTIYKIYPTEAELLASMPPVVTSTDLSEADDNYYYGSVRYTGTERVYYESGQLHYEKTFADGKPLTWNSFHPNGKPFIVATYKDGKAHGKWLYYYDRGFLLQEQEFVDGLKHGIWYQYAHNGVMQHLWTYEHDLLNGIHQSWHWQDPNNKAIEEFYVNGKLEGHSKHFYQNGNPEMDLEYTAGRLNGVSIYYHEITRNTTQVVTYREDVRIEVVDFFENGINKSLSQFKDNIVHGPYKEWYESGQLAATGQHIGGFRSGPWSFWYEGNDQVEFLVEYSKDRVMTSELKAPKDFNVFSENSAVLPSDLTAFLSNLTEALEMKNIDLIKQSFAETLVVGNESIKRKEVLNRYSDEELCSMISLALSTEVNNEKLLSDSLNPDLTGSVFYYTPNFTIPAMFDDFIAGDLMFATNKQITLYELPEIGSKSVGSLEAYCLHIDDYCDPKSTAGQCFYALDFGGRTVYINRNDILHRSTLAHLVFDQIDGKWQIVGL